MKFDELQMGQRFEWNGVIYVKAGPVVAREEATGKSRMIPRYAVLKPVRETPAVSEKAAPKTLSRDAVVSAFDLFYAECGAVVAQCSDPGANVRLEAAKQRFLKSL
jgi:hypothetical protein